MAAKSSTGTTGNYRAPRGGEVDIVVRHGQVLAFVEVKTRTSTAFVRPAAVVTHDKDGQKTDIFSKAWGTNPDNIKNPEG